MKTDSGWTAAKTPWDRLRWARKHGGFDTARAAAESLGMKENTYSAYERPDTSAKHTDMDHQRAIQFARKFKVDWSWLLLGTGTPFDLVLTDAQKRIIAAMQGADEDEQERIAQAVEILRRGAA